MMKYLLFFSLLLISKTNAQAQNNPSLLLDNLPTGSVYTDSSGVLSLTGATNYQILSFKIVLESMKGSAPMLQSRTTSPSALSALLTALPPKTKFTIVAQISCTTCIPMQVSSEYRMP